MKNILIYIFIMGLVACGGNTDTQEVNQANVKSQVQTKANNAATKPAVTQRATQTAKISQTATAAQSANGYKPKNEGWLVDLNLAYEESKKTGKPIMANFTGSDWCGWCKRLDRSVFHKPEFKKWADDSVVLLELDFPRKFRLPEEIAAQNRGLAQSFKVRGYPTVWVFDLDKDASGKYSINALGKTGYTKTVNEFTSTMGSFIEKRS